MKQNVDLTENRMFSRSTELQGLSKFLFDIIKVIKPWDFVNKPINLTSDQDLLNNRSLFAVGNKKERQNWTLNHAYETDEICDCCGQDRGKKPWAKNRCNCYSMIYIADFPWKF